MRGPGAVRGRWLRPGQGRHGPSARPGRQAPEADRPVPAGPHAGRGTGRGCRCSVPYASPLPPPQEGFVSPWVGDAKLPRAFMMADLSGDNFLGGVESGQKQQGDKNIGTCLIFTMIFPRNFFLPRATFFPLWWRSHTQG